MPQLMLNERIKIATEKYKEISHLEFHVGDSATGFPHDNEPYYDVLISTNAFHWFPNDQKKLFIQKAYQSLNSGGRLAILCAEKRSKEIGDYMYEKFGIQEMSQEEMKDLFQAVGLFADVEVKKVPDLGHFKSMEILQRWVKASSHREMSKLDPIFVKMMMDKYATVHEDGSITAILPSLYITAKKA